MSGVFSADDHKVTDIVADKIEDAIRPLVQSIRISPVPHTKRAFTYVVIGEETFIVPTRDLETAL
jgi:hypothetical protein